MLTRYSGHQQDYQRLQFHHNIAAGPPGSGTTQLHRGVSIDPRYFRQRRLQKSLRLIQIASVMGLTVLCGLLVLFFEAEGNQAVKTVKWHIILLDQENESYGKSSLMAGKASSVSKACLMHHDE